MDRRLVGALVLVVAVVAALAGNGRTKVLAGDPERGPIPGPPTIGSCALEVLTPWGGTFGGGTTESDEDPGNENSPDEGESIAVSMGYSTGTFGPCSNGQRFGEVVALVPDGLDYVPEEPEQTVEPDHGADYEPDPDDPWMRCFTEVTHFLGADATIDGRPPEGWSPAVWASFEMVGPNRMQRAAGQRWLGCVAVGFSETGSTGYTGSLARVQQTLDVPIELAQCLDSIPASNRGLGSTSCTVPHVAELFGLVYPSEHNPRPGGDPKECRTLVQRMTGMTDPTAGGRLLVKVASTVEQLYFPSDEGTYPTDAEPLSGTTRYCLVTPAADDEELTGPLLGLGDGPVPLR